ncbi:MAG: zinc ribbon domain-containing protein [Eubacteriales bacterium]|nr:zinc ribbon domain-containing protein [Eubacteriales bacterium]
MTYKMRIRYILPIFCMILAFFYMGSINVHADNLDEIEKYEITAEVNEDATVKLNYHIEWRVLDSESEGPLEWVKIGLSNSHIDDYEALSDTIDEFELDEDGGTYARITFDRPYEENEVVSFDFYVIQDYLYQMNRDQEGYTTYSFTPGWFDGLVIDSLVIRWKNDKMTEWSPECLIKDGYNCWETSLMEGDSYTINVTYPNDAFSFSKQVSDAYEEENDDWGYDDFYDDFYEDNYGFDFGMIMIVAVLVIMIVMWFVLMSNKQYGRGANFADSKPRTKITRTKIVYHTNCPNCGAPKADGKEFCEYCKTSLVKSEEIIKEEELTPDEKQEMKQYERDGEYAYSSAPNTFIRVHTVVIPAPSVSHGRSHGGSGSRGGSHGGGHSCACACASCACACACACAGGGRAGCSNKDFYKNSIKLRQLKMKK